MATGEGKTLAATLPCYLNALTKKSVLVITANEYLAERDAKWMGPIFEGLGMSVGFISSGLNLTERKAVYEKDVVYVTNNEITDIVTINVVNTKPPSKWADPK